jgi:hypothetical protein
LLRFCVSVQCRSRFCHLCLRAGSISAVMFAGKPCGEGNYYFTPNRRGPEPLLLTELSLTYRRPGYN